MPNGYFKVEFWFQHHLATCSTHSLLCQCVAPLIFKLLSHKSLNYILYSFFLCYTSYTMYQQVNMSIKLEYILNMIISPHCTTTHNASHYFHLFVSDYLHSLLTIHYATAFPFYNLFYKAAKVIILKCRSNHITLSLCFSVWELLIFL